MRVDLVGWWKTQVDSERWGRVMLQRTGGRAPLALDGAAQVVATNMMVLERGPFAPEPRR